MPTNVELFKLIKELRKEVDLLKVGSSHSELSIPVKSEILSDPNWKNLPDGTKQWIGPVDPNTPNKVPNVPTPVPASMGPGAFVKRKGVDSDPEYRVIQAEDGNITAFNKDAPLGLQTLWFPWMQFDLIRPAP